MHPNVQVIMAADLRKQGNNALKHFNNITFPGLYKNTWYKIFTVGSVIYNHMNTFGIALLTRDEKQ